VEKKQSAQSEDFTAASLFEYQRMKSLFCWLTGCLPIFCAAGIKKQQVKMFPF